MTAEAPGSLWLVGCCCSCLLAGAVTIAEMNKCRARDLPEKPGLSYAPCVLCILQAVLSCREAGVVCVAN